MTKKVSILGKKTIPMWILVIVMIAAGAGAAAGTVLAGKVTGEVPVAVSQALLLKADPAWLDDEDATTNAFSDNGSPQQVYIHSDFVDLPNRYFGQVADDNTAFQAASEIAVGDWVAFNLPLKNASHNPLVGLVTLDVPEGIEIEVFSTGDAVGGEATKVTQVVRVNSNTWKFKLAEGADGLANSMLTVVISADDTIVPGYYYINGTLKQIGY